MFFTLGPKSIPGRATEVATKYLHTSRESIRRASLWSDVPTSLQDSRRITLRSNAGVIYTRRPTNLDQRWPNYVAAIGDCWAELGRAAHRIRPHTVTGSDFRLMLEQVRGTRPMDNAAERKCEPKATIQPSVEAK